MAADPPVWKYLNARVQLKHDTPTNWGLKPNFIPEAGEIVIYDADSTHETRIKVGDGQTKVSLLPFVNGVTSINGQTGDVSLTIPTVPSNVSSFANDAGYLTSAPVTSVNGSTGAVTITIPTKVSDLTNDSGFITSYTETDPTVPSWAKASSKPSYTASEVGALPSTTPVIGDGTGTQRGNLVMSPTLSQFEEGDAFLRSNGVWSSLNYTDIPNIPASKITSGTIDAARLPAIPSKTSDLTNDSGFITGVSAMTGATTSAAGTAGAVPAPSAGDNVKFLCGDGTWKPDSHVTAVSRPNSSDKYPVLAINEDTYEYLGGGSYTGTAGTNVTIQPNTGTLNANYFVGNGSGLTNISASAVPTMTGATSSAAGTAGKVPAPSAGDEGKFLKGDGTWGTVSSYTLPTASSSTLGGIKVGDGLSIDNGILSVDQSSSGSAYVARYYTTLDYANWTLSSGKYTQTVTIQNLNYSDAIDAQCDIDISSVNSNQQDMLDQWGKVGRIYLDSNGLHAVCYGSAPTRSIPILLRVTGGVIEGEDILWANEESF